MKRIVYTLFVSILLISCQTKEETDIKVMTFNIRLDHAGDSLNNWKYRKDNAAQVILNNNIDILGTQEVLINQLNDLKESLPQYNIIGVGREDGKEAGEFAAIFYNKDRFKEIESGNFWLSETPNIAGSKGWDAACERITTWAILEEIITKKQLFVINTHFDHVGETARRQSVKMILEKAAQLHKGLPIILTGDFNASPDSDIISALSDKTASNTLIDSKTIAKETTGTEWTFHGFGRLPIEKRQLLDYIFVSNNIGINRYNVLPDTLGGIYVSDHKPVMITATLN